MIDQAFTIKEKVNKYCHWFKKYLWKLFKEKEKAKIGIKTFFKLTFNKCHKRTH